eukprot:1678527-Pleurochrysis_carterae.AAC.1
MHALVLVTTPKLSVVSQTHYELPHLSTAVEKVLHAAYACKAGHRARGAFQEREGEISCSAGREA